MKQRIGKALDHLIYLHKIEEKRNSGAECARIVGAAVLLLGVVLLADVFLHGKEDIVAVNATIKNNEYPICCVETTEPKIALTFDAAWGNKQMKQILQILKEQEVRATFFVTGEWVEAYPQEVKAILADGHDLGNHSATHATMSFLSDTEKKEEILTVHKKVRELTGKEMELFRPPHGDYDAAVIDVAKACGYYTVLWNVNSYDWKDYGTEQIVETVAESADLGPGSIILCHTNGRYTADALEELIALLKEKGYLFVPVSELIYRDNAYVNQGGDRYRRLFVDSVEKRL